MSQEEKKQLDPWTVMISHPRSKSVFFITEIEADSPQEAIAYVRALGYCFTDQFKISAKRVPLLETQLSATDSNQIESNASKQAASGAGVRATPTRK